MLILSASTLGLSQVDQNSSFSFCGQRFGLLRSHQPKDSAIATCRKCLEKGGMALMVIHDHEDDNSIWQMLTPDQAQDNLTQQMSMGPVMARVRSLLGTRVF